MSALKEVLEIHRTLPKTDSQINIPLYTTGNIDPAIVSLWDSIGIDHTAPYLRNREVHLSTHTMDHAAFRVSEERLRSSIGKVGLSGLGLSLIIVIAGTLLTIYTHNIFTCLLPSLAISIPAIIASAVFI